MEAMHLRTWETHSRPLRLQFEQGSQELRFMRRSQPIRRDLHESQLDTCFAWRVAIPTLKDCVG